MATSTASKPKTAADHFKGQIIAQHKKVITAQIEVASAKAALKEAQQAYDRQVSELFGLIDEESSGQGRLPFRTGEVGSEAWRNVNIEELGLPTGINAALFQAHIHTLGAIATHCKVSELKIIKGIGEEKAKLIEDKLEAYWKRMEAAKAGA